MILAKLEEALAEIPLQRRALDEVEEQLRSMVSKLKGMSNMFAEQIPSRTILDGSSIANTNTQFSRGQKDRIEEIVDILRANGQALHIRSIAERLAQLHGTKILRTDIEPGINRHIAKVKNRKLAKFGPSIYGLPEWTNRTQPSFAKTA